MSDSSDRELLELAAKAAYVDAEWHNLDDADFDSRHDGLWLKGIRGPNNSSYWNPLTDDGDALQLACKRYMRLSFESLIGGPLCAVANGVFVEVKNNPAAAMRRAITLEAAEVGKSMVLIPDGEIE